MENSSVDSSLIDHTLLRPDADEASIRRLCREGVAFSFAAVCIMPWWVPVAVDELSRLEETIVICAPIGFPLGMHATECKRTEAKIALRDGARELDMVIAIGALKSGDDASVEQDIRRVTDIVHEQQGLLKAIIETSLLTDDEKKRACELAVRGGADYVKTSTGFSNGGATVEDVRLMRSIVGMTVGVKASGGIRDRQTAAQMIAAGATRIGTSSGPAIMLGDTEP